MKKIICLLAGVLALMAILPTAFAVSGYSRQTGMECSACHYQSFPALSEMGRSFKAGGYTMMGAQQKIEGDGGLSLPESLNASVVTKIRYQKSNGAKTLITHTTNDGELQFPDELLLMVGGRVSENIGAQLELNLKSKGTEPVVENFKIPFIYDVSGIKAGIIPFTTGTQGVAYGFELLNTGAVRGGRIMEARKSFSAQQYINTGRAAEGVAVVASNSMFFANISKWSPRSVGAANTGSPTANYFRLAFTPKVGDWDTGVGGSGKLIYQKIQAIHRNGTRKVWKLTTRVGRSITTTHNHPFLTLCGWQQLSNLQIGDRVATIRNLPEGQAHHIEQHEAFIAGAMLGDGGCVHPEGLNFTNFDSEVVTAFAHAITKLNNVRLTETKQKGHYGFRTQTGRFLEPLQPSPGRSGAPDRASN